MSKQDIKFSANAWNDYLYWQAKNMKMANKIAEIINDIRRNPFTGIGQPEPLKHQLSGYWARRITQEHRLVYKVDDSVIAIAQCRYHYSK